MDLRILSIFKQHFLDHYQEPLVCDYSCWGYYDGVSVRKVEKRSSKLLDCRMESSISDLWYNSTDLAYGLKGKFSEQDIGIFRKEDESTKSFWLAYQKFPYITIGLLQLKDSENDSQIISDIEGTVPSANEQEGLQSMLITYDTFDNADLVVLILGNSIQDLEERARKIEELEGVAYFHAIMGVSEAYLDFCDKAGDVAEFWLGINCHTNEELHKITLNLLTSGIEDLEQIVCKEWKFDRRNVKSYYVTGHENLIIEIDQPQVSTLIRLLMKEGFSTHQNKLYRKGVYNITTGIKVKAEDWSTLQEKQVKENSASFLTWCKDKMEKYAQQMKKAFEKGDESLYSYYHSLLLTLNTLSQFENFVLSKNMFYLVYPALDLFDRQLEKALIQSENDRSGDMQERIRRSICEFLDSANSVIYHTIHTDQMFLMIPGYTGTSFSIPIKLCLLYLWFIDKVVALLNDNKDSLEYQCLLMPERESKATTNLIDMGLPHGNRLICVNLSQRSLYMPRDLLSILSHEIAHYVGDSIRHRKERAHYIVCTVAIVIAHNIIHGSGLSKDEEAFIREIPFFEKRLQNYFFQQLLDRIKDSDAALGYYDDRVKKHLETDIDFILVDYSEDLIRIFNNLPEAVLCNKTVNKEERQKLLRVVYELQRKFEKNRELILSTGAARKLIHELSLLYKEIFSDVATYMILDIDTNLFQEAFCVSEGYRLDKRDSNPQQLMRQSVIQYLMKPDERDRIFFSYSATPGQKSGTVNYTIYNRVVEEFYYVDATKKFIIDYVNDCRDSLKKRFMENELAKIRLEVKDLFQKFCKQGDDSLYKAIQDKVREYSKKINKKHADKL